MYRSKLFCLACLVALAGLVGCPGGDGAGTVPAGGTVTLDGQPLEGASVTFSPKASGGQAAAAMTNSQGRFELATGAVPGSYGVTVAKTAAAAPTMEDPRSKGGELSAADAEAIRKMAEGGSSESAAPADMLPVKYKSADTSGLTAEIKKGEKNDFTFALTSN